MAITERQGQLLNKVVEEYIDSAHPISSDLLGGKYDFGIKPAMIRIEIQKLTDLGYLLQPHTSAGRIPTDKGYRFFVDSLNNKGSLEYCDADEIIKNIKELIKREENPFYFTQNLTKAIAFLSSSLALGYLTRGKVLYQEGWKNIFQEPEFQKAEQTLNLAEAVEIFEDSLDELIDNISSDVEVFIGKENFFPRSRDFSVIIIKQSIPCLKEDAILAIVGPKRMTYQKNIFLIHSLANLIEEL